MEEALRKMAIAISSVDICGDGCCPCKKDCNVYSDEECVKRIVDWMKSVIEE